jgi:VanZ family protein
MNRNLLRGIWFALLGSALVLSNLPTSGAPFDSIAILSTNHWFHFLLYAAIVAIPVTFWRRKYRFMLSLVTVLVVIALGSLQTFIPGHANRSQNAMPDLFGVAAGVLLGLNLRMLRASATVGEGGESRYRGSPGR